MDKNFIEGMWFTDKEKAVARVVREMLKEGPVNLFMSGPSGEGKTDRARALAQHWGMDFYDINVPTLRDPEEFFIYRGAENGSTYARLNEVAEAIKRGGVVVQLDEINRVEPWMLNGVLPILDFRRETFVHGQHISVGPEVLFVGTANRGWQFAGTFELDAALADRFGLRIAVDAPPTDVLSEILVRKTGLSRHQSEEVADKMAMIRQSPIGTTVNCSTRTALDVAKLVAHGLPLRHALEVSLVDAAPVESKQNLLNVLNTKIGELSDWGGLV